VLLDFKPIHFKCAKNVSRMKGVTWNKSFKPLCIHSCINSIAAFCSPMKVVSYYRDFPLNKRCYSFKIKPFHNVKLWFKQNCSSLFSKQSKSEMNSVVHIFILCPFLLMQNLNRCTDIQLLLKKIDQNLQIKMSSVTRNLILQTPTNIFY